jgi:hypothetical protein
MMMWRSRVLLTIATHSRMIAAVAMVLAASLLVLVGPLTNKAQAKTESPPRLLGEELGAHDNGVTRDGDLTVDYTCNPTGTSTLHFAASGEALPWSPYPGTFTERGTAELGPATFFNPFPVEGLTTNFEIDSPVGHITGTKRFVPGTSTGNGQCSPPRGDFFSTATQAENLQVRGHNRDA